MIIYSQSKCVCVCVCGCVLQKECFATGYTAVENGPPLAQGSRRVVRVLLLIIAQTDVTTGVQETTSRRCAFPILRCDFGEVCVGLQPM